MQFESAPLFEDVADGPEGGRAFWLRAADGIRIRVGHWPAGKDVEARGTVLLLPGRTEYIEKYGRTAADFAREGFATVVIDWRGQGLADRLHTDPLAGHVERFTDYQLDLAAATRLVLEQGLPQPLHLLAHSMGGCIGLRALMEGLPVETAVFTGPMWGIQMSATVRPAAWALGWGSGLLGLGHLYAPGTKPQPYVVAEQFEGNQLTTCREMFDFMRHQVAQHPELALGGPSLTWVHEALAECLHLARLPSPDVPCLTFVGENERIVHVGRIRDRMARWPRGRLEIVPGAEHEVLMEAPAIRAAVLEGTLTHFRTGTTIPADADAPALSA